MTTKQQLEGEFFYKASIRFTDMVEYGAGMAGFSTGKMPIPPEGLRFDQKFEGELRGPRLNGTISGIDYFYIRADGVFELHLHAQVTTDDGVNIAFTSTGVSIHTEGETNAQLRATVRLFTSSEAYRWVNYLQLWAIGELDPVNETVMISAYQI